MNDADRRDWIRRRVDASPLFAERRQTVPPGLGYRWDPTHGLRWTPKARLRAKRWILTGRVSRRHDT